MVQLTELAHSLIRDVVRTGDLVIDATSGNGHDTLFLSQLVGSIGRVVACDVQQDALDSTHDLLQKHKSENVDLVLESHATLLPRLAEEAAQIASAIMFNLGYLPGGDKTRTTTADSTLIAIQAATRLLKPNGVLTVTAYVGHPGGLEESIQVEGLIQKLIQSTEFESLHEATTNANDKAPRLFTIMRRPDSVD
ncbi:arsenite S-adenosylmethyltransferase [Thalassoglobus neptunius]|uniref:Arsenite S-adenosylmethyltransferase n=1 Tax=Thalassoglobus neptunius TaxID=1938619 RepID=A0A5C5WYN5_9PLAN|nr:class I SAM-dependent methyltransferase [Thalassoglobus neptunius]TWT55807.1 arsenite S-adenosylmethyltransferase [Thalassoglobus neptunius]